MKKVKEILGAIYYYATVIGAVYFLIEYPKYFFTLLFGIIVIGILIVFLSARHVIRYVEKEYEKNNNVFEKASSNNSELAMTTFRWNFIARKFFEHALNTHYIKTYTQNQSSSDQINRPAICMKIFGISNSDLLTIEIPEIRAKWKNLAKQYHPDKFQDEKEKAKAQEKFIKLSKCKDSLIQIIKTRR